MTPCAPATWSAPIFGRCSANFVHARWGWPSKAERPMSGYRVEPAAGLEEAVAAAHLDPREDRLVEEVDEGRPRPRLGPGGEAEPIDPLGPGEARGIRGHRPDREGVGDEGAARRLARQGDVQG